MLKLLPNRICRQSSRLFSITSSPNPSWKVGQNQSLPFPKSEFVQFDPTKISSSYFLTVSGVVPRAVAFVSTLSSSGVRNLAPFRFALFATDDYGIANASLFP